MTPKEKAIELVERFDELAFNPSPMFNQNYVGPFHNAKKIAQIAVDEIIKYKSKGEVVMHFGACDNEYCQCCEFWKQVKQEIDKL